MKALRGKHSSTHSIRGSIAVMFRRGAAVSIALGVVLGVLPSSQALAQLPAPTLVHPNQYETSTVNNYPPSAVPYFEWQPVTDAATYRIQIDNDSAFGVPIQYDVITPNNRYIPTNNQNFSDGEWYWRVRVEQPTPAGTWSEIWQFTKEWGSSTNAPVLDSPDLGATVEFFEAPIFSWSPVMGAVDYTFKLYNDAECSTLTPNRPNVTTVSTQYSLSPRLPNGTYYWRVTPRDPLQREGQASECRAINVAYSQTPQLIEPANNSEPVYTPRFRWTAIKGAHSYNLYYGTSETFQAGTFTKIKIFQTTYIPKESLPNDQDYFWRVAALSEASIEGPYSEVWRFQKKWYHQPVNLTPVNNEMTAAPLFTWTPVREAKYYKIEMSFDPGFATSALAEGWPVETSNTFYWHSRWCPSPDKCEWGRTMYWRVTPYDNSGTRGETSQVTSFRPTSNLSTPKAIFPRYYYQPPSIAAGHYITPYNIPIASDYAVDNPTFYWMKTFVPPATLDEHVEAHHYRIEVDDDPNFTSLDWTYTTRNLSATPTDGSSFVPTPNANYYWRVTAYASSGQVLTNTVRTEPWVTQIDSGRLPTPTATLSPTLQRPANGETVMDTLPSFQWLPQQGAVRYEFEISQAPALDSPAIYITRTIYTQHTPPIRLLGTYFWRVRGLDAAGQTVGDWSGKRYLVAGMQTRWFGDPDRIEYQAALLTTRWKTLLYTDTEDSLGAGELTSLYAGQDKKYWYIGFNIAATPGTTVWYGLYLDADQSDGSGASNPPPDRPSLTTYTYHRPEYAIYAIWSDSQFITTSDPIYGSLPLVHLHQWNSTAQAWNAQIKNLAHPTQVGGALTYSPTINYVEIQIPKTAIGDQGEKPFALSVALFSADSDTATAAVDSVPDDGPSATTLTQFASIADQFTPPIPLDTQPGGLPQLDYMPYLYVEMASTDYLRGYKAEVARDPLFNSVLDTYSTDCKGCNILMDIIQDAFTPLRIYEDNILYWRFSIRHRFPYTDNSVYDSYSPPSRPHAFAKVGLKPAGLHTEGEYSTPTFTWNPVEGAASYRLEIATNPDFSPVLFGDSVNHESFTPPAPTVLAPGKYYWRVRAENNHRALYQSAWSVSNTVNITLPTPSLIEPMPGALVQYPPTFKWEYVLTPTVQPSWGTTKYHLQVASNPNGFGSPVENVTVDTTTWTPQTAYKDGTYYWRVAVQDGSNKDGPYSPIRSFTKQYPQIQLTSPLTGALAVDFPSYIWEPVHGAAKYAVEVFTDPNFSNKYDEASGGTNNARFHTLKRYALNTYYWRVAMIDKQNNYGPWSDAIIVGPHQYKIYLPILLKNQ